MISQQVAKLTAAKEDKLLAGASKSLEKLTSVTTVKAPALPFDIGRVWGSSPRSASPSALLERLWRAWPRP